MSEFEINQREELEAYRERFGQGIEEALITLTSDQDIEMPIDPFSLRLLDENAVFTKDMQIVFRETLYSLIGRPWGEVPTPVSSYTIKDEHDQDVNVSVFEGNFIDPNTEKLVPLYLHELFSDQGDFSYVVSKTAGESSFLATDLSYEPTQTDKSEERLEDPIIKEAMPTLEYSQAIVRDFKRMFPDYSGVNEDTFKKNGRICLYQETFDEEGKRMAINLLASPTNFGYILGYVEEKGKKLVFKYKNLPRIVETQTSKGVQMDHPQTDWEFEADNHDSRIRAFNEMEGVLLLLREHGEF